VLLANTPPLWNQIEVRLATFGVFVMRKVITAISFMLFGASVLIFILALLIPLLRETPSLAGKGETEAYESSDSLKKTIEKNEIQPSITQPQAEVTQIPLNGLSSSTQPVGTPGFSSTVAPNETAIAQNRGESSAMQSPQDAPETTIPQSNEKSTGPASSLTEKGVTEAYESSGSLKKTIEKNEIQPSITQPQAEVTQNPLNGLPASTQPVGTPAFSSMVAPNETAIAQNRGESSAMQSLQNSPEATIPQSNEKSTKPAIPIGAKKKRSPPHEPMSLLVLGDGLFPVGEEKPKASMQKAIDKIIPLIKERSQDKVVVEGHADKWIPNGVSAVRVSSFNKIVSLRRAKAVAKMLEQKGVARDRIIVKGLGDIVPLASNQTNKGRAKNRRVEIKLVPAQ
jgi:outer membrane protein OmpA-like peptidoglycan-associated protein